jgi:hypothetical protein
MRSARRSKAKADGEAGKFWIHAVFVRGWFSATAKAHDNTGSRGGNR